MTQVAIVGHSERTVKMWETSVTASIGSGPFNQHNFFVKNATDLVESNNLSNPTFVRVLPFGGSGGYFSDLIATGIWYAILVLMFIIMLTNTFGIVVGVFLELYFVACIALIIYNYYQAAEKLEYHIRVADLGDSRNRFFEIRETINECASFLAVSDRMLLNGRLMNRTTECIHIMLHVNSYNLHRIVWPIGQFFVCAILNPIFMSM